MARRKRTISEVVSGPDWMKDFGKAAKSYGTDPGRAVRNLGRGFQEIGGGIAESARRSGTRMKRAVVGGPKKPAPGFTSEEGKKSLPTAGARLSSRRRSYGPPAARTIGARKKDLR